ncbi:MAG: hypothetical protein RsTaC01_0086 [Candidatus Paraimprobicoccus trichonymphae]|uniref:Uncharacterized protein n=1 Tax=Candidatus Paraimprobicoccus trichonymphae TaxID=3033793 RepID=A0AA48KZK8_9FIRM|nr:MAG: hypothetical protein RsTaC01_0086 [Candidatus Paraimprobicoccus trichonymphae]
MKLYKIYKICSMKAITVSSVKKLQYELFQKLGQNKETLSKLISSKTISLVSNFVNLKIVDSGLNLCKNSSNKAVVKTGLEAILDEKNISLSNTTIDIMKEIKNNVGNIENIENLKIACKYIDGNVNKAMACRA